MAAAHASLDGVQLLQLPYLGEELNMLVILPAERNGLPEVERMLTAERLRAWDDHLRVTKVQVYFPRFTVRYESALRTPLRQLGMKLAFDASHADFGGIAADAKLCLKEAYVFVRGDFDLAPIQKKAQEALTKAEKDVKKEGLSEIIHKKLQIYNQNKAKSML